MRKAVKLRTLTAEEETEIQWIAASRKEPHNLVQRAKVLTAMLDNSKLRTTPAAHQGGFRAGQSGIRWVRRFNTEGLAGLQDKPKAGRPPTHNQTVRSTLIALA
jgi:transposase